MSPPPAGDPTPGPGADPKGRTVQAAGGVIWRREGGELQLLVVHRPRYDDWSLPKGKLDPGESLEECALREVVEETGLRCELGEELAGTTYVDGKGRPKQVSYWAMTVTGGRFAANDEVDAIRWVSAGEACAMLSYERDADVVRSFLDIVDTVA